MSDTNLFDPAHNGHICRLSTQLSCRVLALGSLWNPVQPHPPGTRHPYFHLYLADGPGMRIAWAGGEVACEPGLVVLVPPWLGLDYRLERSIPHAYCAFDLPALPAGCCRLVFDRPTILDRAGDLHRTYRALAQRIGHQQGEVVADTFAVQALVSQALQRAVADLDPARLGLLRDLDLRIGRLGPVMDYVEQHLAEPIAVADLARVVGVSEKHCTELMRRYFGTTPVGYVQEERVRRAAGMLADRSIAIETIASLCGFGSRSYFTRIFSRVIGESPARYRRLLERGRLG